MKKIILIFSSIFFIPFFTSAQNNEFITVKAGMTVKSCFPPRIRYRYAGFTEGTGFLKNGSIIRDKFNYNFLLGEMEFIRSKDTLVISNKKDIKFMTIAQDTFYFNNGYLEQIRGGKVKVFIKQTIPLKDILKKGAFGTTARNTSIDSYTTVSAGGNIYELRPDEDWVFQHTSEYYLTAPDNRYLLFNRKNAMQILPEKEDIIKSYLKTNKIDFESREDLLKLADYLSSMMSSNP